MFGNREYTRTYEHAKTSKNNSIKVAKFWFLLQVHTVGIKKPSNLDLKQTRKNQNPDKKRVKIHDNSRQLYKYVDKISYNSNS